GAAVERYRYDAYGQRTVLSPTGTIRPASLVGNQIGFTGRYHDPITGLVDFRSRQYDARMGRVISRDSGYVDGASLYQAYFVPNQVDPTGHFSGFGVGGNIFEPGGDINTYPPGWCFLTDNLSSEGDELSLGHGGFGGGLVTAVRFGLTLRGGG